MDVQQALPDKLPTKAIANFQHGKEANLDSDREFHSNVLSSAVFQRLKPNASAGYECFLCVRFQLPFTLQGRSHRDGGMLVTCFTYHFFVTLTTVAVSMVYDLALMAG